MPEKIDYSFNEETREYSRNGDVIASLDAEGNIVAASDETKSYIPALKRFLAKSPVPESVLSPDVDTSKLRVSDLELPHPGDPGSRDERKPKDGSRKAPPQDPNMGDKTPAYVKWYRETHTEAEFYAKYGKRNFSE